LTTEDILLIDSIPVLTSTILFQNHLYLLFII